MMVCAKRQNGFTLIELFISLAVLSVLITVATPSFIKFIKDSRIESESQVVYGLINQARQKAVSSGKPGFLCRAAVLDAAAPSCDTGGGSDWSVAKIVYGVNENVTVPIADAEFSNQVIQDLLPTNADRLALLVSVKDFPDNKIVVMSNTDDNVIVFNGDGTLKNNAPIRISVCDDRDLPESFGKYVEISRFGRLQLRNTEAGTDYDCSPE